VVQVPVYLIVLAVLGAIGTVLWSLLNRDRDGIDKKMEAGFKTVHDSIADLKKTALSQISDLYDKHERLAADHNRLKGEHDAMKLSCGFHVHRRGEDSPEGGQNAG
jgi:hypothetical protein